MITPATIKARFPEFTDLDDAVIQGQIDDAQFMVSPSVWCDKTDIGQSYYVASQLLNFVTRVLDVGTNAAPYTGKSAAQVSIALAVSAIDASDPDALFQSNKYGQQYLMLRNSLGLIITTSASFPPPPWAQCGC